MSKAPNDSELDRVADAKEHDRDGCRRFRSRHHGSCAYGDEHVNIQLKKLAGEVWQALQLALGGPGFDADGATLKPAELAQSLPKAIRKWAARALHRTQYSDAICLGRLLCLNGEWCGEQPCAHGAENPATFHYSMT